MVCLDVTVIGEERYVKCKDIIEMLGVTLDMGKRYIKNIKCDPVLNESIAIVKCNTKGGKQECKFIKYSHLLMWICKINSKTLNHQQLKMYMKIYSSLTNNDIELNISDSKDYYFESRLRDDIYDIGKFNDIKILDKEKIFDFGRIDLYGKDDKGRICCIELKKGNAFKNTKEQLLRYKNSGKFDRIIYCAANIDEDLKLFLSLNNIEGYTYSRDLKLSNIN